MLVVLVKYIECGCDFNAVVDMQKSSGRATLQTSQGDWHLTNQDGLI